MSLGPAVCEKCYVIAKYDELTCKWKCPECGNTRCCYSFGDFASQAELDRGRDEAIRKQDPNYTRNDPQYWPAPGGTIKSERTEAKADYWWAPAGLRPDPKIIVHAPYVPVTTPHKSPSQSAPRKSSRSSRKTS